MMVPYNDEMRCKKGCPFAGTVSGPVYGAGIEGMR
jgi:hypothetical protein